jgi:VanZ family protein
VGLPAGSFSPHSGGTAPDSHRIPSPLAVSRAPYHPKVPASRVLSTWLPVVLWAGVIFALSSIPSLGTGLGTWDVVLRKCAHTTEYAVLAVLLLRAIGREAPALALGFLYAASDELHQAFVRGRHASPIDVAIDTAGLLIGLFAWRRAR